MSSNVSPEQVAHFASVAKGMGIPEIEIPDLWRKHTDYCDKHERKEYGGETWRRFLEAQLVFIKERLVLSDVDARRAEDNAQKRATERRAKEATDAAYDAQAVTLSTWLRSLRERDAADEAFEPLSDVERMLTTYRDRRPAEDAGSWLMAALRGRE